MIKQQRQVAKLPINIILFLENLYKKNIENNAVPNCTAPMITGTNFPKPSSNAEVTKPIWEIYAFTPVNCCIIGVANVKYVFLKARFLSIFRDGGGTFFAAYIYWIFYLYSYSTNLYEWKIPITFLAFY